MVKFEIKTFKNLSHYLQNLIEKKLWIKILVAMTLGAVFGIGIGPYFGWIKPEVTESLGGWLGLPGTLFLKLVQMIMIPLIFASIIGGITSIDKSQLSKLGLRVLGYFILTTTVAIGLGLLIGLIINPGNYFEIADSARAVAEPVSEENPLELWSMHKHIVNILPDNPLASMVSGEMLSIVVFTVIIGVAMSSLKEEIVAPLMKLILAVQEVCMIVVKWSMRLVPYAVFGLMAQLTSTFGIHSLAGIGIYVLCVLGGLLILLIVYAIMVRVFGGMNPVTFFRNIREVQLLAFSTTSSAAVMPLSLKTAEEKLKVKPSVSNFLIPIGATVNMDGTALYQCVSTIFIAQAYGLEMTVVNLILIMITIVAASIGTPSIPGGGIIILASVLQSVGIPSEGIVLIIGVDRILGMFRTAVNVTGDLTACTIFDKVLKSDNT